MPKTFKAILSNDTLQWLDAPPEINADNPVNVHITLLEENIINENQPNGKKMAEALDKIAKGNAFVDVDPQQWQRQARGDRPLPQRD